MTDRIALSLALLIIAAVVGDQLLNDGALTLAVARRAYGGLQWVIFWR